MIDFATLQGVTIPEGVVTQIADASGRVLWSANTFDGIIYLRPSTDISVDSTITLVPADATAAYMLINEEVSDGAATEIKISSMSNTSGTAVFSLAGNTPNRISRVTGFHLYVSGASENTNKNCDCRVSLTIGTAEYEGRINRTLLESYELIETTTWTNAGNVVATTEEIASEINSYVAENGVLPDVNMSIFMSLESSDTGGKNPMSISISQAYVVIECE